MKPFEGYQSWFLAAGTVVLATALRLALDPWLGPSMAYGIFFLGVAVTALYSGFAPALMATMLSALAVCFLFLEPRQHFLIAGTDQAASLASFVVISVTISLLGHALQLERKKLATSAQRLRRQAALIDLSPDAIITHDIAGTIKSWSSGAEKLYGWTKDEAIGKATHVLLRTEYNEPRENVVATVKAENNWTGELVHTAKDGRKVVVQSYWHAETVDKELEIFESNIDITERKEAAEALRQSEERYRLFVKASSQIVWVTNAVGEVREDIPSWYEYTAQTADEARGFGWMNAILPEHRQKVADAWRKAAESKKLYEVEYRLRRFDGVWREILARGVPFFNGDGSIYEWVGTCIDITERKEAEEALRESEECVRKKLENVLSPEGNLGLLDLKDLVDVPALQKLMNDFFAVSKFPMSLFDMKGNLLVGVGWQDICAGFHRVNPESRRHCQESDTRLTSGLRQGETRLYKCKNNMWDMATPIYVAGQQVGIVFTGQFFFEGETVDRDIFHEQARQYGFDERDYLGALSRVPRFSRETVDRGMGFLVKLADMLSQLGFSNVKLARLLTERERLTESLRQSELFYRQTLDSIPGMVFTTRPDGYCDYQSQQWMDYTGIRINEHLGDGWNKLLHPDDRPLAFAAWRAAVEGKAGYDLEYRVRRHDGIYEWFKVRGEPIRDESGRIVRWFGVATNIEALKQADEALRTSHERLKKVMEVETVGVMIWDLATGCLTDANDAFLNLMGYNRREVEARELTWQKLTPPEYIEASLAEMRKFQATGRVGPYEKEYFRKDGSRQWLVFAGSSLGGNTCVEFCVDVSDRKKAEEALKAAQVSAEQAKAEAEKANAAKDEFLGVLSHELRTPLSPVLAAIQLMQRGGELSEKDRQHAEIIRRNAELEARLIDDLLDLTRIARGKVGLKMDQVNIRTVLQRVADICRPEIEAKRICFAVDIEDGPHLVIGDAARLQQILWNLLNNSIKFTPEDGSVCIRSYRQDREVVTEVSDSGIGIDPEVLPVIFNAFEQGNRRITRQFGGLGLGLAITKRLVEMHDGTITAESQGRNNGAVFRVTFPIADEAAERIEEEKGGSRQEQALFAREILLVEDHRDTATLMKALLEDAGYKVYVAADVAHSLVAADERHFDLLISDLGLPDGSGLDLVTELQRRRKQLRAIALSGFGREEDVRRSKQAGFIEHLTKPVDFEVLLATVERVI